MRSACKKGGSACAQGGVSSRASRTRSCGSGKDYAAGHYFLGICAVRVPQVCAEARREGSMDDFARQLGSARYDTILVTGHTDRFGSNEYNQKLSERRANAVKDYLVSRDIPADRVTVEGRGTPTCHPVRRLQWAQKHQGGR